MMEELRILRTGGQAEYAAIPLDLPPIHVELDKFDEFCTQPGLSFSSRTFKFLKLRMRYGDPEGATFANQNEPGGWEWTDIAKEHFPDLVRYCDAMPTIELTYVSLLSAVVQVEPHNDIWTLNETTETTQPSHYRGLLTGAVDHSMYFTKENMPDDLTEEEFDKKDVTWLDMPETTNTFLMNCRDVYHGTRFRGPKLALYTCAYLDGPRHNELMERSLRRYQDYAIRVEDV